MNISPKLKRGPRALLAVALAAGLVTVPAVAPAQAADALSCLTPGAESAVVASARPVSSLELAAGSSGTVIEGARAFTGMYLPQAVVQDATHNQTLVAYFEPVPTSSGAQKARVVIVAVRDGRVLDRTVLQVDPTPAHAALEEKRFPKGDFLFDQDANSVSDSHNALSMAIDRAGYLHITGGIHNDYLAYWRSADNSGRLTTTAGASEMTWRDQLPGMVVWSNGKQNIAAGADKGASSYPTLFFGPRAGASATAAAPQADELYLSYRAGTSADGDHYMYRYDPTTQVWSGANQGSTVIAGMPQAVPLLQGRIKNDWGTATLNASYPIAGSATGATSPYATTPVRGPDGRYWMTWTWRTDAASANANAFISAAYSYNLSDWYIKRGVKLPQTIDRALSQSDSTFGSLVVDGAGSGNGVLNNAQGISFRPDGEPVITYSRDVASSKGVVTGFIAATRTGLADWKPNEVLTWNAKYDPSVVSQTGASGALDVSQNGWAVPATGNIQVPYSCNGQQRLMELTNGKFNGSLVVAADGADSQNGTPLPAAIRSVSSELAGVTVKLSSSNQRFGLTYRTAASQTFVDAQGRTLQWVAKWDSAPIVVDGSKTVVDAGYPVNGSELKLFLVELRQR